ncbi:MAG: lytic murein transglycosylase, partial [Roseitalea porphyridii]
MVRLAIVMIVFMFGASGSAHADLQGQYETFLETTIWPKARAAGVSRATFDRAMGQKRLNTDIPGLVRPGQSTPQRIRQAEFSAPARYFNENNVGAIVSQGRRLAAQHASTLSALERRYGVPGRIILAIWGRESAFGRVDIPHDAFQVLGTKAFMSTRPELFQGELVAALAMVERGMATPDQMKSSWAGALGQP